MIPFTDLLNHGGDAANAQWRYDDSVGAHEVITTCEIRSGDQVLINYSGVHSGEHPFHQRPPFYFYVFYGFLEQKVYTQRSSLL